MASPPEPTESTAPRAAKRQRLLSALRARIIDGQYLPGQRIPTRVELLEQFSVSTLTLQKALDRLVAEGFLVTRGRSGTFVTEHPPHLYNYALVFPHRDQDNSPWPRFWTALTSEARRLSQDTQRRLEVYYSMSGHRETREYRELRQAVRSRLFAGMLFCAPPRELLDSSIIRDSAAPCVSIGSVGDPRITAIHLESSGFIDKALDYLQARGRRRIAMITATSVHTSPTEQAYLEAALHQRDMTMKPYWFQALDPTSPQWACPCVHLLMSPSQPDRPDGLIIGNDNLVESASSGVVAAGVRVPQEIDIVGHCNFPWPTPSVLPLERLGYDARDLLAAFLHIADARRAGQSVGPADTVIQAKFEKELTEPQSPANQRRPAAYP